MATSMMAFDDVRSLSQAGESFGNLANGNLKVDPGRDINLPLSIVPMIRGN